MMLDRQKLIKLLAQTLSRVVDDLETARELAHTLSWNELAGNLTEVREQVQSEVKAAQAFGVLP